MRGLTFCAKRSAFFSHPSLGPKGGERMRLQTIGASVASLMVLTMLSAGCAKKEDTGTATRAEQAAARAEDAARRAESAASRVEAAAQRAEAAAEKADRMFSKHIRK